MTLHGEDRVFQSFALLSKIVGLPCAYSYRTLPPGPEQERAYRIEHWENYCGINGTNRVSTTAMIKNKRKFENLNLV